MKRLAPVAALLIVSLAYAAPALAQTGYGGSVAIVDDEVFVGEAGNQASSGFVYVYRMRDGAWTEVAQLSATDAENGDGFGRAIAADGDLLLVSATNAGGGAVYMFTREGGNWRQVGRVAATEGADSDRFGGSLAVSGDWMIAGATGHDEGAGAAYLFRRQGDAWLQQAKLVPDEPQMPAEEPGEAPADESADEAEMNAEEMAAKEQAEAEAAEEAERARQRARRVGFGSAVAIHGNWAMVSAPQANERAGVVYVYRREGSSWEQVAKLGEDGGSPGDSLGMSIALADGEAMIGGVGPGFVGMVRVFRFDEEESEWAQALDLQPFDATRGAAFGSAVAFNDREVFVGAPGAGGREGRIYRFERDGDGFASVSKIGATGLEGGERFANTFAVSGDLMVAGMPGDDFGAGSAMIMRRGLGGWDRAKVLSDVRGLDPVVGGSGLECVDGRASIFECQDVDLVAFLPNHMIGGPRGISVNDIWGWEDPETGREYALVGMMDRTSFVDMTDPYNPVYVGILMKTAGSRSSIWRDIKVHADHAFIVADSSGEHGVQVFDLTRLRQFEGTPITFDEDAHYDGINAAHNIVIDEQSAMAYVVGASGGGETCGGGLHMINIEDPKSPMFEGCFADTRTGRRGTGYSHDAMCVVYEGPDDRYSGHELCFGSNETALSIADVTDRRNPVALSMATYPNVAYTHQGWISEDHKYFYMNDEGDEASGTVDGTRTLIFDVQDLEDPILIGEYIHDVESMDHNLYIRGDHIFESNYNSGLRVLDIKDRENPALAGYFDSVPWGDNSVGSGGMGSWSNYPFFKTGVVAFTSGREGLLIVKPRGNDRP